MGRGKSPNMQKLTTRLLTTQLEELTRLAKTVGGSRSVLIRAAIQHFLSLSAERQKAVVLDFLKEQYGP